jgi:hypothetical protein
VSTAADFRRIALTFADVEEYDHGGEPAFRAYGGKFAGLSSVSQGYGNLRLTPELQALFCADAPKIFLPHPTGFGRMGHTHIILQAADEAILHGALLAAYNLRVAKKKKKKK